MDMLNSLKAWCVTVLLVTVSVVAIPAGAGTEQIDQLIIHYHDDARARMSKSGLPADPQLMARTAERYVSEATGLQVRYKRAMATKTGAHVVRLPYAMDVEQARMYAGQLVANQPDIDYAEPDYRRYPLSTVPNDLQLNKQWHLMSPAEFAGAANVFNAWDLTKGSADIVVAVLDTGITNHEDLRPNLVGGSAAKSGYDMVSNDPAGDGDGRDADPSDPGVAATSKPCIPETDEEPVPPGEEPPVEENTCWHGTYVSGLIAARPDNGKFVAGIGWNTRLSAVRILSESEGRLSDQVDGMLWAGGEKVPGIPDNKNPAVVLNLSIGTDNFETCSRTEQNAINILKKKGVSVVVAAGNENRNVEGSAPANCNGVISVTGVMKDGARTPFANYGELNDIAAPAEMIVSTSNDGKRKPADDSTAIGSGTSQAAPQVVGVLALMLAANDKLLDESVIAKADLVDMLEAKLKQSARPFPANIRGSDNPRGCNLNQKEPCVCTTATCGAGLLDAHRAVKAVSTVPQAKAGNNRNAAAKTQVTLDGSNSSDDEYGGKIASFQWEQVSGPQVVLTNADKAKATFTAPEAKQSGTQLVFELVVTDDTGLQAKQQVVITVPGKGGGGSLPLLMLAGLLGLLSFKNKLTLIIHLKNIGTLCRL